MVLVRRRGLRKRLPTPFLVLIIPSLLFTAACVVGEVERRITPQDTAWIEKGRTTRDQVVAKLGEPAFTGTHQGVGQYAEYTIPPPARLALEPTQSGPFPQVQRAPVDTVPEAEALGDRFWLIYDAQGVVEDFGFGSPPRPCPHA